MKKVLFLLLLSVPFYAQIKTESFDSSKLAEKRAITISLPPSYEKNTTKKYPILLLLDGDFLFDPFYGAISYGSYWDDFPETIIVGIHQNHNDERVDDSEFEETQGLPAEKGAAFFEFIGQELLPYIEKKYRTAPFRMIAGLDTTAGYLNFFLYKENPLFNAYISLNPELAPLMEKRVAEQLNAAKSPVFYYLSTSEDEIKKLAEPIKMLNENIKNDNNPLINYKFESFKGAGHYSQTLYAIPSALHQIFETYKPISSSEFTNKIASLPSGYVDYLEKKYSVLNEALHLTIPIRINDFKAIEAAILKNNAYSELDQLAILADKFYPKSMLAEYELALMYEKQEDYKKAMKRYQNASQMLEIGSLTKTMMLEKYDLMKSKIATKK
ncbi:alpha/beta hydrolase [Flavobacterium succinicans]|uniref:Putative esterase n=1 Tax=Flavobacterium succinicans TaxID=29536 RepID=A0A199XQ11_9FLAO|nr:alpha/beta hydrolase-fold protein [Flavobacterium succinicans]OAZ03507.1 putative esterase [Flavobacterium succinicans]